MGKSLNCQWMAFAWIWQQIAKQIYFPTSISESWLLRRNQNCKADSSPERTIPPTLPSAVKPSLRKSWEASQPPRTDWRGPGKKCKNPRQKCRKIFTRLRGVEQFQTKWFYSFCTWVLTRPTQQSRCDQIVFRGFSDLKTGMFQGGSEQCETIRIAAMAAIKTISVYSRCTKSHFHPAVSWAIFWLWLTY